MLSEIGDNIRLSDIHKSNLVKMIIMKIARVILKQKVARSLEDYSSGSGEEYIPDPAEMSSSDDI